MIDPEEIVRLDTLAQQVREGHAALIEAMEIKVYQSARVARLLRLIAFSCRDALRTRNVIQFDEVPVFVDAETGVWRQSLPRNPSKGTHAPMRYVDIDDADAASQGVQRLAAGLRSSLLRQLRGGTVDRTTEIQAEADRIGAVVTLLEGVDR